MIIHMKLVEIIFPKHLSHWQKKNLPPVTHSKDFSACFDRVINVASLSLAFGSELPTGGDILPAREREGGGRGHHPSHLLKITLAATMTLHSFFPLFLLLSAFLPSF